MSGQSGERKLTEMSQPELLDMIKRLSKNLKNKDKHIARAKDMLLEKEKSRSELSQQVEILKEGVVQVEEERNELRERVSELETTLESTQSHDREESEDLHHQLTQIQQELVSAKA
ncbi:MAG: hypothetical protein MHM6MM_000398, partial [Cercozoa sp. M6MM]